MSKHFKFLVLALMLVGLTSGSAFAGTTFASHGAPNTAFTIALEGANQALGFRMAPTTPAGGGVGVLAAPNGVPISYYPTQSLAVTNLVKVTLLNAAFNGQAVNVCAANATTGSVQVGTGTPAAASNLYSFQMSGSSAAQPLYLTDVACSNVAATAQGLGLQTVATTSAKSLSATIEIQTTGGVTIDSASTANIATIQSEWGGAILAAGAHVIDYLGTPGNGTRFTAEVAGANNGVARSAAFAAANRLQSYNLGALNSISPAGAANAGIGGLTVSAVVQLSDTAAWSGVSKVFVNLAAVNCADSGAANAVGTGSPSGTVSLTIPQASYNGGVNPAGANSTVFELCIVGNGTTALQPRTLTGTVNINVTGTGANDPAAPALVNADVWTVNAFQAMIPWAVNASTIPTYCHIANASTSQTATVILDVLSSEGGVTLSNASLGTIAPVTSKLMTITANSVSLAGGAVTDLTSLGTDKRHMDRVTVTTAPANVTLSCIQTDPVTGGKRNVLTTP